jgi:protoporphyrinogen oxidase
VQSLEKHGDRVDVGAQVYHDSYTHIESVIDSLGLRDQVVPISGKTHYRMKCGKSWQQGASPWFSGLGFKGNFALQRYILSQIVFHQRPPLHYIERVLPEDGIDAETFFEKDRGNPFGDYLIPLLCAAMNVSTPAETNVQHLQHIFRITAFTKYYTFKEGNEQLWRELAQNQPIRFGSTVNELVEQGGMIVGVRVAGKEEPIMADHVVLAIPPGPMSELLPAGMTERRTFFDGVPKHGQIIPVVYLNRRLSDNISTYMGDVRDGRHYLLASDCAVKAPHMVPSGNSILTLWDFHPKSSELFQMSDADLIELAISDLDYLLPDFKREWVVDTELVRHEYSHPPYGTGSYQRITDFLATEQGQDGLHFATDLLGGSYMECALIQAHKAVSRILERRT